MQWKMNLSDLQKTMTVKMPFLSACFTLLFVCTALFAQTTQVVTGTVVSAKDGEPLIGVNVLQQGTANGVVTDINGNFTLSVTVPCELSVTYIGYHKELIKVTSSGTRLHVELKEDNEMLDEVVVVGYGTQKKSW